MSAVSRQALNLQYNGSALFDAGNSNTVRAGAPADAYRLFNVTYLLNGAHGEVDDVIQEFILNSF